MVSRSILGEGGVGGSHMKIVVTGGCGFIGSNFIRLLLQEEPKADILNIDLLTYAGNQSNLVDVEESPRYRFIQGDICDPYMRLLIGEADWVVNFAAESHVDRSTSIPDAFVNTNTYGACRVLEAVRKCENQARVLQVSTDEVYGDIPTGVFSDETALLDPSSPYSASKAGGDLLAYAYHRTFGTDVIIARSTNNYGPYQHPEKLIPLFITNLLCGQKVPLYDRGTQIRDWLYVEDNCRALLLLLREGRSGETYNIGANQTPEVTNLEITERILQSLGKPESMILPVKGIRPGHDNRYAVNTVKIRARGWKPMISLEEGLEKTIEWYKNNQDWWKVLRCGLGNYV